MSGSVRSQEAAADTPKSTRFDIPLELLRMPKTGRAYDLSSGWWPGMPLATGHPPFHVMTYRSPAGQRNQKDLRFLHDNPVNFGFISEFMMCTTHTGTHIDALAHITCGPNSAWHGGFSSNEFLGDFGPLNNDASQLPPVIKRGVLLDIPKALGVEHLAPHQGVGAPELEAACRRQGIAPSEGGLVLIRTGTMLRWPILTVSQRARGPVYPLGERNGWPRKASLLSPAIMQRWKSRPQASRGTRSPCTAFSSRSAGCSKQT